MTDDRVAARLRRFLLLFAIVITLGAVAELWFAGHTAEFLQLIPFGLAGVMIVSALLVLTAPSRRTIRLHRWLMVLVIAGSLFGVYQHVAADAAFQREIRPAATRLESIVEGLFRGSPPLAPGVFAIAAILALTGTSKKGSGVVLERRPAP